MNPSNNKGSHKIINEYFSMLHAEQDVSDVVGDVVKTIFEDEHLDNKEYHLGSLLNSNVINASVDYVKNLIQAVLEIDNFSSKQICLEPKRNQNIVTVAGSGKKGVKTINISTPATIVAASCGAQIIKPCSRSTSSLTGSSDFFTYLGGKFKNTEETCSDFYKTNVGFFSIEGLIPKFDSVYGGKALVPTALSYALPAVINPIKTNAILYGLSLPNIKTSIHSLHKLGYDNVVVGNTSDDNRRYVDEIGLFRYNNLVYGKNNDEYDEVLIGDPVKILKIGKDQKRKMKLFLIKELRLYVKVFVI